MRTTGGTAWWPLGLFGLLLGCETKVSPGTDDSTCVGCDTADTEGVETGDSADSVETGETGETADTADTSDSTETADSWDPDKPLELCINEFMPDNKVSLADETGAYADWIELHNPGEEAISLDGWTLTDDADEPDMTTLTDLLVIEAGGFLVLFADGLPDTGPDHLGFALSQDGGEVGLYAPDGRGSVVTYASVPSDISASRVPDCCTGEGCWEFVYKGTPEGTNETVETEDETLVEKGATWMFWDQGTAPEGEWTALGYDDSAWSSGAAPLGYGDSHIVSTVSYGSDEANKYTTTYFRLEFEVEDPTRYSALDGAVLKDDGAIVYLNGEEIERTNMPEGTVDATTFASASTSDETGYTVFEVDTALLAVGSNVLAAEIHQSSLDSSDLGFDLKLVGEVTVAE